MEHRWSARKQIDRNATIFNGGTPVALGQLKNVSQGGAFVSTRDGAYRRGMCLELEFALPSNGAFARHRVFAMVVHVADDGIGLMFKNANHQSLQKDILAISL